VLHFSLKSVQLDGPKIILIFENIRSSGPPFLVRSWRHFKIIRCVWKLVTMADFWRHLKIILSNLSNRNKPKCFFQILKIFCHVFSCIASLQLKSSLGKSTTAILRNSFTWQCLKTICSLLKKSKFRIFENCLGKEKKTLNFLKLLFHRFHKKYLRHFIHPYVCNRDFFNCTQSFCIHFLTLLCIFTWKFLISQSKYVLNFF
jgi:hypothetical protein